MAESVSADLCIIGAGSGGLSIAAGAAQLGVRVVLFERGKMGGDCLNYGCVPSKSLLAAAKAAAAVRNAGKFGIKVPPPHVDFPRIIEHVNRTIAAIAPHDSVERFEGLGVRVIRAEARFTGPHVVAGGGAIVRARRFVIATGAAPLIPPIPGVDLVSYFTNETIFSNTKLPEHLLVIGGGPVGIEMAQAFCRLGARVTVFEAETILAREDPELRDRLREVLLAEGVDLHEHAKVVSARDSGPGIMLTIETRKGEEHVEGSHLLIAVGRAPRVDTLDLEKAGIEFNRKGIKVDAGLRTTNRRVYAIGDAIDGPQFTHVANYHAGLVIRSALFRMPARVDYRALPAVTYTDPELAQVGLTEAAARKQYGDDIEVLHAPFMHNDRAETELETGGMIKVMVRKNGTILGASILGPHAGELIYPWILLLGQKARLRALTGMIAPYPTLGEIGKRIASHFYSPKLFSKWPQRIVKFLQYFG
jgi:pyruvate/2-oxoglutarate dehydrogenase complex dihydrolipoamide dehydrogenase (E3) component